MTTRRFPLLVLVATIVVVATSGGSASTAPSVRLASEPRPTDLSESKDLWATINVCDTPKYPDTIGIRGSMPGLGHRTSKLQMRFRVQYRVDGKWRFAKRNADSGWQTAGRTVRQVVESGQNFTFLPPTDGGAHELRGLVRFRWVRGGETRVYQQRFTEPGHKSTAGADPKNYSAGLCEID
jgi:hypothetical protein